MIRASHLTKTFGAFTAVNDAVFTIPSGVICGFVGPNGAGKTTTLRMLATLETPTSGTAFLDETCVRDEVDQVRKLLGFMPDYCGSYPHMTTADFLEVFARACGLRGTTRRQRTSELVDFLDLGPLMARPVERLSKGQKQRLSLARALLPEPAVLILDEPAAGLDPRARIELYELLKILAQDGTTVFVSSHILSELAELVSWVVVIESGTIRYHGSIDDLEPGEESRCPWVVQLTSNLRAAKRFLLEQHAVLDVAEAGDDTLHLHVDEETETVDELLARMFAAGVRARQIYKRERRLEDLFLAATEVDAT